MLEHTSIIATMSNGWKTTELKSQEKHTTMDLFRAMQCHACWLVLGGMCFSEVCGKHMVFNKQSVRSTCK